MKKFFVGMALPLLLSLAVHARGAEAACPQFSPGGLAPVVTNPKLLTKTRMLCFDDFAVLHSGLTHGPLWSAEFLTRSHVSDAKGEVRTNRFYDEPALPEGEGASLSDYRRSGYDRGHMSPAGDRWNDNAMAESFSLANIVPQNPDNNRHLWAHIEAAVRRLATTSGDTYVVTGPLFTGARLDTIGASRVFVPTQLYKVVYVPGRRLAFAIVVDNVTTKRYDMKTVHELEAVSGLRFPGIPDALKDQRVGGLNGV
jgi:endonuclease G